MTHLLYRTVGSNARPQGSYTPGAARNERQARPGLVPVLIHGQSNLNDLGLPDEKAFCEHQRGRAQSVVHATESDDDPPYADAQVSHHRSTLIRNATVRYTVRRNATP